MSVEIVCEWIERTGGAEGVLDAMIEAYPGAPVHALWNDAPERTVGVDVRESWLAHTPLRRAKALALPFFDPTWRHLHAVGTPSKMLISSYIFAHHARIPAVPSARKYVYVHSPARYLWAPEIDPRGNRILVRATASYWRRLDRLRAGESYSMVANSGFVRKRVQDSWGVDAGIIYPPVDVARIAERQDWRDSLSTRDEMLLASLPADFILGASRLVAYKSIDKVIEFAESTDLPVIVAGGGPDKQRLEAYASARGVHATFVGEVSSELLYALYQQAAAFVFPPVEDFGIMPVEAMAAGGRVIVGTTGGVVESVLDGVTGVHADRFSGADARAALNAVACIDVNRARSESARFSKGRFVSELKAWVER